MPIAASCLEVLQVCKLMQCVRAKDKVQIEKLTTYGVPNLINYNDPNEGNTALSIAIQSNDDDMIQFLLELGAHPDVMDLKGHTMAMRAVMDGHVSCLEKLLRAGASMTLTDLEGKGIIFYCLTNTSRHTRCLELILEKGADVNNRAKDGTPVFLLACESSLENEHICLALLEKGSDPNCEVEPPPPKPRADGKVPLKFKKNVRCGRTALMAACNSGSVKVVKALLSRDARVNNLDIRKNHAAHFAAKGGYLECLQCMAGYGAKFDQINWDGNTPIHLAAMGGHAMCCKYLSQRGCNPKTKNSEGNTARTIAKEEGFKEAKKELRKAEKSFGRIGKNNDPKLLALYDWLMQRQEQFIQVMESHCPEKTGYLDRAHFCEVVINMEAPIKEQELENLAKLYDKGRENIVVYMEFLAAKKWINKQYLLSAFEGKKKKPKRGRKGGRRRFKLIMPICTQEYGPRTSHGGPPEQFIPFHIHFTDVCRFDRDHPPKHPLQDDSAWYLKQPERSYINLNEAAKTGDFESLRMALRKGVPVDTRDKYFKTALMTAASCGHLSMVKFLVKKGASINLCDNFKWTALHHACHAGQLDVVQFLMEHGGEMDTATMNGGTPLTRAIESSRDTVVQYLIDKGVKMLTENRKGMSPMDIAEAWADLRVIDIVQTKWDTLPHPDLKKGKGAKKGKGSSAPPKGKRPVSAAEKEKETAVKPQPRPVTFDENIVSERKESILRSAHALADSHYLKEDITYVPLKAWTQQLTTLELIRDKVVRRERFGWEVDFPDFQMPFQKNITTKLAALE